MVLTLPSWYGIIPVEKQRRLEMKTLKKIVALLLVIIVYPFALIGSMLQGAYIYAKEFIINTHQTVKALF